MLLQIDMECFDQIMPFGNSGNEVGGYITAMNEEFYVHLTVQDEVFPRKIHLKGCEKLHQILKPVLNTLEQHLNQISTIKDMLFEIQNALEQQIRLSGANLSADQHVEYRVLFEQLQVCRWDKVHFISPDFHELHLKSIDESEREHILKIWIPDKFPNEGPKLDCNLPQEFQYRWLPDDTLLNIFTAFQETLCMFADFWNIMDELDKNTWILEPERPQRNDCKRRIALVVEPVREKFNKNIHKWNEFDSVLTNLQQVLELEFPSPSTSVKEEFCMECGICYSYLLGEAIPEMTCDNPNCNQPFHHACLYEYIRMLPDVRSSFNKLFGQCPYCSKPLWCTIL